MFGQVHLLLPIAVSTMVIISDRVMMKKSNLNRHKIIIFQRARNQFTLTKLVVAMYIQQFTGLLTRLMKN